MLKNLLLCALAVNLVGCAGTYPQIMSEEGYQHLVVRGNISSDNLPGYAAKSSSSVRGSGSHNIMLGTTNYQVTRSQSTGRVMSVTPLSR